MVMHSVLLLDASLLIILAHVGRPGDKVAHGTLDSDPPWQHILSWHGWGEQSHHFDSQGSVEAPQLLSVFV